MTAGDYAREESMGFRSVLKYGNQNTRRDVLQENFMNTYILSLTRMYSAISTALPSHPDLLGTILVNRMYFN